MITCLLVKLRTDTELAKTSVTLDIHTITSADPTPPQKTLRSNPT